ncbi:MAG: type II toxin-antitoxin system RelE/ParE family toxin [Microcystis panniformis WG22]|uniref:Type II toxin-antitoxin system RelE/ParE family toxin n=1 Tax=Microcystis aeruginosa Ma_MB_F_20061100_S20D TaxID=2486253 RepID=A0A552EI58_MICAE|nr:type II toxin-antitoxin system RelE/ParE family toxin [Microcystis panniformis WG22]TRU34103.1 MAG: type II toxin-antitoxin system RelE/ParE family toxin [Microcystis aeruginosa Ma_MB_F_20061100_S20D]TRU39070.1 MAG: type II toxin-antitoxin system RelE/ParE family toxin [Microcystis aeruginosa Ma_MB_F_20061100_S20]
MWRYIILKPAERYLKRLQPRSQERILNELDKLLLSPTQTDFKKLKGRESYRLRVGNYLVLIKGKTPETPYFCESLSYGD